MSLSSKVIMSFLAGTFSALLAWVIIDFNGFYQLSEGTSGSSFAEIFAGQAFVGIVFGMLVGMGIGLVNGISAGSGKVIQRNLAWGAVVGLCGGLLGLFFGQMFFGSLYKDPREAIAISMLGPLVFIWNVIIRAIGWSLIGLFLGLVLGLPSRSAKAARHGALGGFIGGLLGGMLFEIIPYVLPPGTRNPGIISRGISMTITGASIGFFVGLVETLLKQAWIRVIQGRNEGKEYVISKNRTTIGRDELSDIGLFGDRSIEPLHAIIETQNGRHLLRANGAVMANGQQIGEHLLRDGDLIHVGSMRLEFREKATASSIPRSSTDVAKQQPRIPTMDGICQFCGSKKNPDGSCACSVSAQPPVSQPQPAATPATAPSAGGPRLVGLAGVYAGQTFSLQQSGEISVGRETDRAIQLSNDTTVSRKHAKIVHEGGTFVAYDEGSSNGTSVNGARITRQPIHPGDIIEFGSSSFRFEE